jgi:ceramide glucosyltransferase
VIAAHGAVWAGEVFALTLFLRLTVAWVVGWAVLRDRQVSNHVWLIPLRDLVAVAVWLVSFWGHTVVWRGDRFELKQGRLVRIGSDRP